MDLAPGTVLDGKYRVDRSLAAGGTSRIYVGNPLAGAGMVAIKQVLIDSQGRERHEDYLQFRREFELLQALAHPALPKALAFFEEGGHHYLIEEFVPGRTLEEVLGERGRLPVDEALGILVPLLDVLAYLHEHKVVYRDLKPSNVLITKAGTVRLIDLGAARRWRPGATKDTVPLGTPGYAPPEAYGRGQTDARSDVYSAGVLLHQMLTGRDPAEGEAWKFEAPEGVPEHVSAAVMKAVALDVAGRFESVEEMASALRGVDGTSPRASRDLGSLQREICFTEWEDYMPSGRGRVTFSAMLASSLALPVVALCTEMPGLAVLALMGVTSVASLLRRWLRFHRLAVCVFEQGLRVESPTDSMQFRWDEIRRVRLIVRMADRKPLSADISTQLETVTLESDWPGFEDLIQEVLTSASLTETSAPFHSYTYVGTHVRTFERLS